MAKTAKQAITAAIAAALAAAATAFAAPARQVIHISKEGAAKDSVRFDLRPGPGVPAEYVHSLRRNIEISGCFTISPNGAVRIQSEGGQVVARGHGRMLNAPVRPGDAEAVRRQARAFSDALVREFAGAKGFADSRIAFVRKIGTDNAEIYTCYPDGMDVKRITADKRAAVGPRWHPDASTVFYTGFLRGTPLVYILDLARNTRKPLANFKGLATGAAIAPDAGSCAIILSFQGNPELYRLDLRTSRLRRMTRTRDGAEASPCWSPDGSQIAFVTDTTRHPQIYVLPAGADSRARPRRLTSRGSQNVNPDWGPGGRIAYATQRGGQWYIAVMDAASGDSSAKLVTGPGTWEHPSWAPDGRHIVASRDGALWIIDTEGDPPQRVFNAPGNWTSPDWSRSRGGR